jgi:CheY-like chemotaxis protein
MPSILLVDDDLSSCLLLRRMIERLGSTCDVAYNGAEAVAAVSAKSYEFILMDLYMPVMNGWDSTRRIRDLRQNGTDRKRAPIIYGMSSTDDSTTMKRCLEAGMGGVLCKPISISVLGQF